MADPNPTVTIKGKNNSGRAFKQARADMDKLKKSVKAGAAVMAAAAAATVALIARTAEQTRGVRAYSAALGVSTENLSRWGFAAERVGLSSEKVADIMKDAADKIGDAYRNNAGEAKEALTSLGLDIERLAALSPDQQLLAIAGALDNVGTTAERVQIAESIGNDLSLLLPLLEDNAKGLKEMSARADELGVTLTSVEAANIEKADAALKDLGASFESISQTLTAALGPALADFLQDIRDELPTWVRRAEDAVLDFGAAVMSVWEAMNPSDITGQTSFGDALIENQILLRKMRSDIRDEQRALEEQNPIEITGVAEIAAEARRQQQENELAALFDFEDQKTAAVRAGNIARLQFSTWAAERQTKHVVGEAIRLTRGVAHQNRALFEINKIAGIANAVINVREGISRSLAKYPWPLAGIMAGLHAAAGAAEISAIKSASFGGGGGVSGAAGGGGAVPTPPSDFATAPDTNDPTRQGSTVNIHVEGNVFANDEWREALVRQLETALDNDEITIR